MGKIKWNIAANMGGRIWSNIISLVFIPVYLHFLGIEMYGLVGFWVTLMNIMSLLDFGLGLTLNREMARLSSDITNRRLQRETLRTFEVIYWTVALLFGLLIWIASPVIVDKWLNTWSMERSTLIRLLRLMAAVLVFQFPFALYQGGLMGLQRQVLASGIQAMSGSLRGILVSATLWLISPTIEAFFYCQLVISLLQTLFTAASLWKNLPLPGIRAAFRPAICRPLLNYTLAVSGNTVIGSALSQLDKVILSKMIPLDQFGYYTLSWSVASALWSIIQPFNSALFPRFTQLIEEKDPLRLSELYHRTCHFVSVFLLPAAVTLLFFSREVMLVWTHDPVVANNTHLVVSLLVIGAALNGLASVPCNLQFAAGWPQLMMYSNMAAAILFAPLIYILAKFYGGAGAAAALILLNLGYIVITIPLMHRRLLKGEKRRWYIQDVGKPLGCAVLSGLLIRLTAPAEMHLSGMLCFIALTFSTTLLLCSLQSKYVREYILQKIFRHRTGSSAGPV